MSEVLEWGVTGSPGNTNTATDNSLAPPNGFPEGMAYQAFNDSAREVMAAVARDVLDTRGALVSTGTAPDYTVTPNRAISLDNGLTIAFRAHAGSGGDPVTLDADTGDGAVPVLKTNGNDPTLVEDGIYVLSYSAADSAWIVISDLGEGPALRTVVTANAVRNFNGADFSQLLKVTTAGVARLIIPASFGSAGSILEILVTATGTTPLQITNSSGGTLYRNDGTTLGSGTHTLGTGFYRLIKIDGNDWLLTDF